jgi:hypothetical protein
MPGYHNFETVDLMPLLCCKYLHVQYIHQYRQLKDLFDLNKEEIILPGSDIIIKNLEFQSDSSFLTCLKEPEVDAVIAENNRFRYPVFLRKGTKPDKAIILLHGLNERTWHKHLTGAKFLAERSGKAVIMFPLSFHINRGLPEWTDVRKMAVRLNIRKAKYPGIREASLVNLALSERLTECPQRFLNSGLQSTMDLIHLMNAIHSGRHPLFMKNTNADLFAYSISCMLLQALMISNPDNILKNTRIVLFAGGSLFDHMQGISKYIMDNVAFDTIRKYYLGLVDKTTKLHRDLFPLLMENRLGKAFSFLIAPDIFRKERENFIKAYSDNLMIIALQNDKVMPVEGIRQAMGEPFFHSPNFRILDFPYSYTHENPFPVLNDKLEGQVEQSFSSVFQPTLQFFMR